MSNYSTFVAGNTTKASKIVTPQTQVISGREADMTKNSAGGVVFKTTPMTQLDRFLILGSDRPSYYASAKKLTTDNAKNIISLFQSDAGVEAVNRIVEISEAGRAPKNDPALFALAMALVHGTPAVKQVASAAIPKVARIGTHLFTLASFLHESRGWGRSVRRGFSAWYNDRSPLSLAKQITKYAGRNGWTHKDVLRLAHVRPNTPERNSLFAVAVGKEASGMSLDVGRYLSAVDEAKVTQQESRAIALIQEFGLPFEVINTELLNSANVWRAMLPTLGLTAIIRNLGKMSSIGVFSDNNSKNLVIDRLIDDESIKAARIHPINVLSAHRVYTSGHGVKGSLSWNPNNKIVSALEDTFYRSFAAVTPTGKTRGIFLDISGSMGYGGTGVEGLTARDVTAVMSMLTLRSERNAEIYGFSHNLIELPITDKMSLEEVIRKISGLPFGGTDCSLPAKWANQQKKHFDSFEVYTDNETYLGNQVSHELRRYRQGVNAGARMVVASTEPTNFTIADPNDPLSLDVVGFDSAAPQIIGDFVRGDF